MTNPLPADKAQQKLPEHIFREYDIRGLAGSELSNYVAESIGKAFGTLLSREGKKKISVSYDLRTSSTRLQKAPAAVKK